MPKVIKPQGQRAEEGSVSVPDVLLRQVFPVVEAEQETVDPQVSFTEPKYETIIKEVYLEPKPLTLAEIELRYHEELEQLRQKAATEGFAEGMKRKEEEITACLQGVEQRLQDMEEELSWHLQQYYDTLHFLALQIAEKLLYTKLEEEETILRPLVMQTIAQMKGSKWLRVEVSEELSDLLTVLQQELERLGYDERVTLRPVPAPKDTCRVLGEEGAVISTLSVQSENLRQMFLETAEGEAMP